MALLRSMWSGLPSKSLALFRYKHIHICTYILLRWSCKKSDRCVNSEHQSVRKHVCWQMQATLLKSCWQIGKIFYTRTPWNINTQPVKQFHFTNLSLRSVRIEARAPLHVCWLLRGPLQPSLLCSLPWLALAWRALLHLPQLSLCLDRWDLIILSTFYLLVHRRVRECVPVRHVQVCLPPSHPHVWNGLVLDSGDEKYPLVMFFNWNNQVAIFFWSVHVAALLLTTVLLVYHVRLIQTGATTFEANRKINSYNLGWRQNWREVLGERWYLALINPFVKSKLPHNGVIWDTQNTWRLEAPKNRWD